ncbi:MAG: hypothetical protein NC123_02530 [Butyrivibrio sp.]|nr:hypothetical protein [Acetatifactor muris]MCM1558417.1 hypothetical protein [Butyrivibrio sp.]
MEWKKILINRKLSALMIVLFLMQMIVFWQDCEKNDRKWMERYGQTYDVYLEEQERQHIDAYQAKIQAILEQADAMDGVSIFSQENSFSKRNVALTKEAFEPLLDMELTYVKGRTITEFFAFRFGGLCVCLCGLVIALELSEIGKKRVRSITFPTEYGRLRLAFERSGALFGWAFAVTFIFQAGILLEGMLLFHEDPRTFLSCPAQTFACFGDFPLKLRMWQALILYQLYRTVILYVIMVLVWSAALILDHMVLAVGISGGFMAVEYFLYAKIDGSNVRKLLKYCNIWYQTAENDYFTRYQNLNILEYAVNRNTVILTALAAAYLLGSAAGIFICCRRYPCSSKVSRLRRAMDAARIKLEGFRGRFLEKRSLTGLECYKTLISQKGLIAILLLAILICYRADFTQIQRSTQQELYYTFIDHYLGEPGEASDREIAQLSDKLEQVDIEYAKAYAEAADGGKRIELAMWYDSFSQERLFLKQIREQTESLKSIAQETGIAVWYVNLHSYAHLLKSDDAMLNLGLLLVILWNCIGMYIGESASGMVCMIKSSHREKHLYRTKLRVAALITSVVYFAVVLFEILSVAAVYGLKGIGAPVQSIPDLSHIRIHCTIWQYFFARYLLKGLIFSAVCIGVCKILETVICKKGLKNGIKNRKSV